jgi:hypothetical protein
MYAGVRPPFRSDAVPQGTVADCGVQAGSSSSSSAPSEAVSDTCPSTTDALGAASGSYSTFGTAFDAAIDAATGAVARRLPATDANSSPHEGHESLPYGTSAAHAPQTIDCAVIRYLVYASTLPAGRRWLRLTDAPKRF